MPSTAEPSPAPAPRLGAKHLQVATAVVLLVSLARGIAFPHIWAATHLFFTYEHGFVKRGLLGELLRLSGIEALRSYHTSFWLGLSALVAGLVLLLVISRSFYRSGSLYSSLLPLLYASSLAVPYLGNAMGYLDHLGLLVTLIALAIRSFWRRLAFGTAALGLTLFVHEANYVLFAPVLVLSLLLEAGRDRWRWTGVVGAGAALTGLTYLVGTATISPDAAAQLRRAAAADADFRIMGRAFRVLHRTAEDNLAIMHRAFQKAKYLRLQAFGAVATVPTMVLLLWGGAKAAPSKKAVAVGIAAGLSPLMLHAFGWDLHRWNTWAITTCFLVAMVMVRFGQPAERVAESSGRWAGVFAVLCACIFTMNMTARVDFLDGRRPRMFPFRKHVRYWERVAAGRASFPDVPERPKKLKQVLPVGKKELLIHPGIKTQDR